MTCAEDLLVGYRWFDNKNVEPQLPFGFGLSCTTFKYSNLKLFVGDGINQLVTAQFEVKSTGPRDGAEAPQLLRSSKQSGPAPPEKELKGFKKVFLRAGSRRLFPFRWGASRRAMQREPMFYRA